MKLGISTISSSSCESVRVSVALEVLEVGIVPGYFVMMDFSRVSHERERLFDLDLFLAF